MRLDVSKALVAEGEEIPFQAEIELPGAALMGEAVMFPAPARLVGHYASVGDVICVRGQMDFAAHARCVRCLQGAQRPLRAVFDVTYALAADADNPDLYVYDGAWIDLTGMAADAALLALPMQWLCRDDCEGLCPICGADRNTNQCSCRMEETDDHPFSALQQLLTKDESEV